MPKRTVTALLILHTALDWELTANESGNPTNRGCARGRQPYPMLNNPRWAASATASVRPTALSFSKIAVT